MYLARVIVIKKIIKQKTVLGNFLIMSYAILFIK